MPQTIYTLTTKLFTYKNKQVSYRTEGKGSSLILLHGYQSDSRAWNDMIPFLKEQHQLIIPDLPGHGKSELIEEVNTMELMADVVKELMQHLNINKAIVAGHSMGGYVALALAEKTPNAVQQLYLVNSHPFADNTARIKGRQREIKLIADGRKELILKGFTHSNFAKTNASNLQENIDATIAIGLDQPNDGIIADLNGLMIRKDRSQLLANAEFKCHIIYGAEEDKFPVQEVRNLVSQNVRVHKLSNCSHMTIIEDASAVARIIQQASS